MKISRQEATKELKKRGYKPDKEGRGVWVAPNGDKIVWFIALRREGIEFDSSTWAPEMTRAKKEWEKKKRLAKLKNEQNNKKPHK